MSSASDPSPAEEKEKAAGSLTQQPKRGARACVACRKGKNRCVNDGQAPCVRCKSTGAHCIFETPPSHKGFDEERVERIEQGLTDLKSLVQGLITSVQGQGMSQSNLSPASLPSTMSGYGQNPGTAPQPLRLDASFNARSPSNPMTWEIDTSATGIGHLLTQQQVFQQPLPPTIPQPAGFSVAPTNGMSYPSMPPAKRMRSDDEHQRRSLPTLPNYKAPPHPVSMYGIIPSTAPSSDDEDGLPGTSLTAPLEALAQAASEAQLETGVNAIGPSGSSTPAIRGKSRKRRRPMPPPPNAFPDVVTRELVSDATCRQIFAFFMENCLPSFPILDMQYDTYESMRERTPWSINSIVMVAASRMPNAPTEIRQAAEHGAEEAQGIARSSLFGPTVRPEGCQAMGIVAAWQTSNSPYLSAGHSLRMAMDLGLHRALGKIAEDDHDGRVRSPSEQRSLVVSARTFLCLYWLDLVLSSSSGRPHYVHEDLVASEKLTAFLKHPLSVDSDKSVVANFELLACRTRIENMCATFGPRLDTRAIDFARRSSRDLQAWFTKWDAELGKTHGVSSYQRKRLLCSLNMTQIFLYTSVLKHQSLTDAESLSFDARELAMSTRQSASAVVELCDAAAFRASLRYATHEVFVDLSYATLLLLKLSKLFPEGIDLSQLVQRVGQLQALLFDYPGAQRFSMTIKIALERFCKAMSVVIPLIPDSNVRAIADLPGAQLHKDDLSDLGVNLFPFDVTALPDSNWVGAEVFPEWIKAETGEQDWTFDTAWTDGIDRLFLPQWSTGIADASGVEW